MSDRRQPRARDGMSLGCARKAGGPPTHPAPGSIVITRLSTDPPRFQLSVYPCRPGFETKSADIAWDAARQFAAREGLAVWFTADGVTFAEAVEARGSSQSGSPDLVKMRSSDHRKAG